MSTSNWSVPETEVVQRVHERLDGAGTAVLATIVDVEGNAYRRPGAKMLFDEDGAGVGSITAGCLEDDLRSAAESVRETGRPELVTYDMMEDEEDVWGLGVGCNGIIDVLLERVDDTYRPAVEAFDDGRDVAILTVLSSDGHRLRRGDRAYYDPDEDLFTLPDGSEADEWPTSALSESASDLATRGRADRFTVDHEGASVDVFVDGLSAPSEFVVFGTGHDVGPVTELAAKNDFRVTVVGFRGAIDLDERFPAADRTVSTSPGAVADDLDLDERTYAVVMTHNFVDDRLTVEALLSADLPYVGLMGPRDRFERMRAALEDDWGTVEEGAFDSLYTPVGLDLGSETPYQIAHSIVAEVLAVENDRTPQHLETREGHIHDRVEANE